MNPQFFQKIEAIINQPDADDMDKFFRLKNLVYEAELQNNNMQESVNISHVVQEVIANINTNNQNENLIPSGFSGLDDITGGFQRGELIVLGSRPGMGKTLLLINLALHISRTLPVLYLSLDLSDFLLTSRMISALTDIPYSRILQHRLTDGEKAKISSLGNIMDQYKLILNDSCNPSISLLKSFCREQIVKHQIKVIIVDYLQMLGTFRHRQTRDNEISMITRELKHLARENDVCIILSSQLSRAVETRGGTKMPQLSDLRESGAIEQDADKVLFLYRPEYYKLDMDEDGNSTKGVAFLDIAKNRNGKLGTAKLQVTPEFTSFIQFLDYPDNFTFSDERLKELDTNPF